ncbi:dihydroorotase [Aureimonas jatrophae]|nr:dihydroorotase family protein [Aureimonas jatrophae]MBB3950006.1 dihydroorotase (multifunctional complex type) [Aureimonas jatrophae]
MSGPFDMLVRGGEVVDEAGVRPADVAIRDGRIAALLPPGEAAEARETLDAAGLHVLPGAIDIHVHVRAPAFPERGTVESETAAAVAGGITALFEMPITQPCCNSGERVRARVEHFRGRSLAHFAMIAAPGRLDDASIEAIREAGAIAFKIFTTAMPAGRETEFSGLARPDEGEEFEALRACARTGLPVIVHAESAQLLDHFAAATQGLDPRGAATHERMRPTLCESVAVARLLAMNMEAGAKLHIAHVTSAATVRVLRAFRGTSDFTAETCPHYLLFTGDEDVARAGVFGRVNPPIRAAADRAALWEAVRDGTIGFVTTDHAAFSLADKERANGDFTSAPPGTPGLEILVPTLLDAVAVGQLSLPDLARLLSAEPARRFALPTKGRVEPGFDADLTLVDLAGETRFPLGAMRTKARDVAHLYADRRFRGRVAATVLGGRPVYAAGELCAAPASGQYLTPDHQGAFR